MFNYIPYIQLFCRKVDVTRIFIFIIILITSIFSNCVFAQIDVTANIDSNYILIGDHAEVFLTVKHDVNIKINQVQIPDLTPFELIQFHDKWDTIESSSGLILTQSIKITCFEEGKQVFPPLNINYSQQGNSTELTTSSKPFEIAVIAIQVDTTMPTIRDIKGIIVEPIMWSDWLPYVGFLLGICFLVYLTYWALKKYRKEKIPEEKVVIIRPAHEIALEKLHSLEDAKLWQKNDIKAYQSQLTYIIREYLENRYQIPALEYTTDEILEKLKKAGFSENMKDRLIKMLQLADLVKFAKAKPPISVHEELLKDAFDFVQTTKKTPPLEGNI